MVFLAFEGKWGALMESLVRTYPGADRYLVGLAEWAVRADSPPVQQLLTRYDHLRPLIPSAARLKELGYDYADPPFNYRDPSLLEGYIKLGASRCYFTGADNAFLLDGATLPLSVVRGPYLQDASPTAITSCCPTRSVTTSPAPEPRRPEPRSRCARGSPFPSRRRGPAR